MAKNQANPSSEIAQFVRAARMTMGLTQEEFGEKFNRTKANANAWEKGRHEPSFAVLRSIAAESGVSLPASFKSDSQSSGVVAPDRPAEGEVVHENDKSTSEKPTYLTSLSPAGIGLAVLFDSSDRATQDRIYEAVQRIAQGAPSLQSSDASLPDLKKEKG